MTALRPNFGRKGNPAEFLKADGRIFSNVILGLRSFVPSKPGHRNAAIFRKSLSRNSGAASDARHR